MKLCLIRHGNAKDHNVDALRQLSDQGKREAKNAGDYCRSVSFKPQKIFHSELVRAKETASLVLGQLGTQLSLVEDKDLLPNSPISTWYNNLLYMEEDIMLVGHMPYMGIFAEELLDQPVGFPTGGVMIFEVIEGKARLLSKSF